jgi:hypothetical protein
MNPTVDAFAEWSNLVTFSTGHCYYSLGIAWDLFVDVSSYCRYIAAAVRVSSLGIHFNKGFTGVWGTLRK